MSGRGSGEGTRTKGERPAAAGWQPPRGSERRALRVVLLGAFLLHTLAVLWVWRDWGGFGRGGVLAWMDFPSSLAYLRLRGGTKLAWSLAVGGLQWALIGAGLSLLVGRSARGAAEEPAVEDGGN